MKIMIFSSAELYSFLSKTLPFHPFRIYIHILTRPYLQLLEDTPPANRPESLIILDGEKSKINNYAVRYLRSLGYRRIYYCNRLHAKVIVIDGYRFVAIGSANLSERSLRNHELIVVLENPPKRIIDKIYSKFEKPVIDSSYTPRV